MLKIERSQPHGFTLWMNFRLNVWWDQDGWSWFFNTPLFGIGMSRNSMFPDIDGRGSEFWIGGWPIIRYQPNEKFFRFNWKRRWNVRYERW